MKTTTKRERRAAKRDAIQWQRMVKKSRRKGWPLLFRSPAPGTGVAAWARHRREGEGLTRLSVKIRLPLKIEVR